MKLLKAMLLGVLLLPAMVEASEYTLKDVCDDLGLSSCGVGKVLEALLDTNVSVGADCSSVNPRFTDNEDGTVTDNCTNLIWLKNANCDSWKSWSNAQTWAGSLAGDGSSCNLIDGSVAGDWRLPNIHELHSLIDYQYYGPALTEANPFLSVQSGNYWSAATDASNASDAWYVSLSSGYVNNGGKSNTRYVWPVRGGQ